MTACAGLGAPTLCFEIEATIGRATDYSNGSGWFVCAAESRVGLGVTSCVTAIEVFGYE